MAKLDLGVVSLPELAQHAATIRDATDLPIVCDADTGFGNALNVRHTVRTPERSGVSAIHIEDQVAPKKCGHFSGKRVVALDEARMRIRAALDARHDDDTLIVARTDARANEGYEAALERAEAFIEEGADITFIEAPGSEDEMAGITERL